jgi:hypothetical protein
LVGLRRWGSSDGQEEAEADLGLGTEEADTIAGAG